MQILIDILDDVYEDIVAHNGENREGAKSAYYFESLIKNGISLPKGHGDLIDANGLKASMLCYMKDNTKSHTAKHVMSVAKELVDLQEPVIKASNKE